MKNLYFGISQAPYRVDLCNYLHDRLDCEILHLRRSTQELGFDTSLVDRLCTFEPQYYPEVRFDRKSLRYLKGMVRRYSPDLIFVSEFSMTAVLLTLLKRFHSFRYKVVSICDDSMEMIEGNDFSRRHTRARRIVPHLLDNLILDNPQVTSWYRSHFHKGVYFPIIEDEKRFRAGLEKALPQSVSLRAEYGLDGRKVILFVGRLTKLKNIPMLLRAYSEVKDKAALVIIGSGPEEEDLKSLDSMLGTKALFLGQKQSEDLMAWYNIAGILVLPSIIEPFGAVTGEALESGCHVLVSKAAGSAALIQDGVNGSVFDPRSENELTDRLSRLIDSMDLDVTVSVKDNLLPLRFEQAVSEMLDALQDEKNSKR